MDNFYKETIEVGKTHSFYALIYSLMPFYQLRL